MALSLEPHRTNLPYRILLVQFVFHLIDRAFLDSLFRLVVDLGVVQVLLVALGDVPFFIVTFEELSIYLFFTFALFFETVVEFGEF